MRIDVYTKVVLTVIAVALLAIAVHGPSSGFVCRTPQTAF